jgi:hypothetical protein
MTVPSLPTSFKKMFRSAMILAILPVLSVSLILSVFGASAKAEVTPGGPTAPPAQICGDTGLLSGPSTPPQGAVIVPAGDNMDMFYEFRSSNTKFWFEPGVHTVGNNEYSQIQPGNHSEYIGAPGAILDGQHTNRYAFTAEATDVRIAYLEVRNFGHDTVENGGASDNDEGVINHDAGANWTIEYIYAHDNDGAAVFMGSGNNVHHNCLKNNGQYGASAYHDGGVHNLTFTNNEVAGNNTDDWEARRSACGCTGGMKFWETTGGVVTDNWVHDNRGTGIWADFNNVNFLFENNYIEGNDGTGLFYEVSYNFLIKNNTFKRNALVEGKKFSERRDSFPLGAIYISESGGDSRAGSQYAQAEITGNYFTDNWDGVVLWENSDRFCRPGEDFDTTNNCPRFDQTWGTRYKTQNIAIHNNQFNFDREAVNCTNEFCGRQAVFSNYGTWPTNSPYLGNITQQNITYNQNNHWFDNEYHGPWHFMPYDAGHDVNFNDWRAQPYGQDAGSTFDGPMLPESSVGDGGGNPSDPPADPPAGPPAGSSTNDLDADTSTLEGSAGKWVPWFSSSVAQSAEAAHSGSKSLRVDVTAPYGWGVQLWNWPGFGASSGTKLVSFWGKLGAGPANVRPDFTVEWLNANGDVIKNKTITLPALTTDWQKVSALVDVPAGATTMLAYIMGDDDPGTTMYFDDMVAGDAPNMFDAGTAGGEGSRGDWRTWFSADVDSVNDQAHKGTGSLRATVTAPYGWGIQPWNWPGVAATAGAKRISYWAKQGSGQISHLTLAITWFDSNQEPLRTDEVKIDQLTADWQQGVLNVAAPEGTATGHLEMYTSSGEPGESVYIDDIVVTSTEDL